MVKIVLEKIIVSLLSIISLTCIFSSPVEAIVGQDWQGRPMQPFIGSTKIQKGVLSQREINGHSVILYNDGTKILLDEEQKSSCKHARGSARYAPTLPSEWTCTGPYGGMVSTLVLDPVNPNTIYAGTYNSGIFKSTDGGENWVPKGLENTLDVIAIAIDPSNPEILYASTRESYGLFKSIDGGNSWINIGFTYHRVYSLAIDPLRPSWIYAGPDQDGIWLSTDGGENWIFLWELDSEGIHWKILVLPDSVHTIYKAYGYSVALHNPGGIRKSIDGGTHWTIVNNGLGEPPIFVVDLTYDPNQLNVLYATVASEIDGVFEKRLFKTTDACSTWHLIGETYLPQGHALMSIAIDPSNSNNLYVTSHSGGVFKSMDAGETWIQMNKGLPQHGAWPIVIDPSSPKTVYVGYAGVGCQGGGIYKSTNGGASWDQINNGLSANDVRTVMVDPSSPNTIYAGTINGEWKSTDGGQTWQPINDGLYIQWHSGFTEESILSQAISKQNSNRIYVGTGYWAGDGVFRTDDGGQTWHSISNGLPDIYHEKVAVDAIAVDPTNDNIVYAGLYDLYWPRRWYGIYKTIDGGLNWTEMNTGLTDSMVICLAIDPSSPNIVYAGTETGVFKSIDAGATWAKAGTTATRITSLAIDTFDTRIIYASTAGAHKKDDGYQPSKGIYKTTDGGMSWTQMNSGLERPNGLEYVDIFSLSIDPLDPNILYAGTDVGVYRSIDGGNNWSTLSSGLTYVWSVTSVQEGDSTRIYAGTCSYGVVQYPKKTVGVEAPDLGSTGKVILHQNYPNPLSQRTVIGYQILSPGHVTLKIYDISGRLIKTLVNREQDVGYHKAYWNGKDELGQNVANGIYFYHLEVNECKQIKKMMVIR